MLNGGESRHVDRRLQSGEIMLGRLKALFLKKIVFIEKVTVR